MKNRQRGYYGDEKRILPFAVLREFLSWLHFDFSWIFSPAINSVSFEVNESSFRGADGRGEMILDLWYGVGELANSGHTRRVKRKGAVCRKLWTVDLKEADTSTSTPLDATAGWFCWMEFEIHAGIGGRLARTQAMLMRACTNYTTNNRVRLFPAFY